MPRLGRKDRISHYFGDIIGSDGVKRVKRDIKAERKRMNNGPTIAEVNDTTSDILHELGLKTTALMYGSNREEGARFI